MAIVFNSTSSIDEQSGSLSTLTWAHTCNAADVKLMVNVQGRQTVSGVTYNGVALTKALETAQLFTYEYNSVWYLDSPTTGSAKNIVVTYSSASTFRAGTAAGLSGGATGIGATAQGNAAGSNVTATANITTTATNSILWAGGWTNYMNDAAMSEGAGQTIVVRNTYNDFPGFISTQKSTTTAGSYSVSITVTGTGANLCMIAVELKLASSIKTKKGLAKASVKTFKGLATASVKTAKGLA